jgi:glutathione S-transferase
MVRLHYFDFPGRGEAIRDALRLGAVPFEDIRISFPEFQARRAAGQLPWDVLPVLELEDGTLVSQSNTILRWAGVRAGLTPADPGYALRVDALLDSTEDYMGRVSVSIRVADEAVRAGLRVELATRWLPEWFGLLERRLAEAGHGWLVGDALGIADLKVLHFIDKLVNGSLSGLRPDALSDFPALAAWRDRVHAERRARLPG